VQHQEIADLPLADAAHGLGAAEPHDALKWHAQDARALDGLDDAVEDWGLATFALAKAGPEITSINRGVLR
jgi:hypothetical protein